MIAIIAVLLTGARLSSFPGPDQFLTPTKGDLIDELDHPRLPDPTLLPKIDSGLWQEYTLIWARKTEGEQTSA